MVHRETKAPLDPWSRTVPDSAAKFMVHQKGKYSDRYGTRLVRRGCRPSDSRRWTSPTVKIETNSTPGTARYKIGLSRRAGTNLLPKSPVA